MLIESGILAGLIGAGIAGIYSKLPKKFQQYAIKYPLITRVAVFMLVIGMLGATLTGLFAGAMLDLLVMGMLYVAANKEQFMYLWDARDAVVAAFESLSNHFKKLGDEYRASKAVANDQVVEQALAA
jgi:hypothetical protein